MLRNECARRFRRELDGMGLLVIIVLMWTHLVLVLTVEGTMVILWVVDRASVEVGYILVGMLGG